MLDLRTAIWHAESILRFEVGVKVAVICQSLQLQMLMRDQHSLNAAPRQTGHPVFGLSFEASILFRIRFARVCSTRGQPSTFSLYSVPGTAMLQFSIGVFSSLSSVTAQSADLPCK
jgi:hypothetical protein